ncbi:amphi-Trp domain-containing protein [Halomarina oriensis]|uniref:Amphi-Trp domain-containing protein n=1 Tax=Halomarina oriensis TaxID=671145 RepID=A0A6B0GN11_9EURY|nr:amphi-Trp domain-containing protein [Halomarina oriensis]MWG33515.1 amphi-Trp domain-containing protein [Halomarina oriensis]
MAEKLQDEAKLSREDAADRLEGLAREIREGSGSIRVGNKTVELSPSEEVTYEISVKERSSLLRGNRETITVTMEWKP